MREKMKGLVVTTSVFMCHLSIIFAHTVRIGIILLFLSCFLRMVLYFIVPLSFCYQSRFNSLVADVPDFL